MCHSAHAPRVVDIRSAIRRDDLSRLSSLGAVPNRDPGTTCLRVVHDGRGGDRLRVADDLRPRDLRGHWALRVARLRHPGPDHTACESARDTLKSELEDVDAFI